MPLSTNQSDRVSVLLSSIGRKYAQARRAALGSEFPQELADLLISRARVVTTGETMKDRSVSGRPVGSEVDRSAISANVFHKLADRYQEKFGDLTLYDDSYRRFGELLRPGRARVLDAACGPGNVARFLLAQRHELDVLGIDLAPRMVELAQAAVPSARFTTHDCRHLADLKMRFDGIICAFGLPYLSPDEGADFIRAAFTALEPQGVFYLSTMLGRSEECGLQRCSSGDELYVNYYAEEQVIDLMSHCGFRIVEKQRMPSPNGAAKATTDLIVIARKPTASI